MSPPRISTSSRRDDIQFWNSWSGGEGVFIGRILSEPATSEVVGTQARNARAWSPLRAYPCPFRGKCARSPSTEGGLPCQPVHPCLGDRPAMTRSGRFFAAYGRHRYAVLFYTLLLTLGAAPLLAALHFSADLLQIFLAFSLVVAVLDVSGDRWRMVLIVLASVVVGLRVAPVSTVGAEIATGALVVGSVLALVATASAVRFAVRAQAINAEQIYAALSAYLLAGLFFGVLHWAIAIAWPGSLAEAGATGTPTSIPLSTAI